MLARTVFEDTTRIIGAPKFVFILHIIFFLPMKKILSTIILSLTSILFVCLFYGLPLSGASVFVRSLTRHQ